MAAPVSPPLVPLLAAAVIALAMLLPPAYLVVRTLSDASSAWEEIYRDRTFQYVINTAWLAVAVTAGAIVLAVPLAWLTTVTDLPFKRFWAIVMALPLAIPSYVVAFTLVSALGPRGIVQDALSPLGVERLPDIYGFPGAWLALTFSTFPYVLLPVRAAIQGLDSSLHDAARSLGRGPWRTFFTVTLLQMRPAIAAGALLVALYTISDFGVVSILRYDSLTRVIYVQYTSAFDRSAAAALALLLVFLTLLLVVTDGFTRGRARYFARSPRALPQVVNLRAWRWPALAACVVVAALGLLTPLSIILYWLLRGVSAGQTTDFAVEAGFNSVYISGVAAIVAVAAALPIAFLATRHSSVMTRGIEKVAYLGFALPGVSIALALVFFAANYAIAVYQTIALLVFAYVVRFLPQALSASRSSMVQVNPAAEEAARSLGKGGLEVFRRITLPQIMPGVLAGAALVFLTTMKELPATLLLSPTGFNTLATEIWSATTEAFFTRAALPALILIVVSATPMVFTVLRESALAREAGE
ncbi:MAG: ABC transporter permease subunit [Dehalococcoidia bacterium]|nr:ABC transporter permease subunit [Dehalococcoidia bacterium]